MYIELTKTSYYKSVGCLDFYVNPPSLEDREGYACTWTHFKEASTEKETTVLSKLPLDIITRAREGKNPAKSRDSIQAELSMIRAKRTLSEYSDSLYANPIAGWIVGVEEPPIRVDISEDKGEIMIIDWFRNVDFRFNGLPTPGSRCFELRVDRGGFPETISGVDLTIEAARLDQFGTIDRFSKQSLHIKLGETLSLKELQRYLIYCYKPSMVISSFKNTGFTAIDMGEPDYSRAPVSLDIKITGLK